MNDLAERQDRYTMASCRFLLRVGQGLPKGETAESMGEFVEAHRLALHGMKQRRGKGQLVLQVQDLGRKWPCFIDEPPDGAVGHHGQREARLRAAREEPLMRKAKEIFGGTWLDEEGKPIPDPVEPEKELF